MSKKSNPEKGLPSVTIDLDKPRTLKWNNEQTIKFEEWALPYLDFPQSGIKRGMPTQSNPTGIITMDAKIAIMNFMNTAAIQTRALYHALQAENNDLADPKSVDELVTNYKASGQSWDDLLIAIQRSFLLANDPSSLASQEERWKALRELMLLKVKEAEMKRKMDMKEISDQMTAVKESIAELDSGETQPGSPTA